MVEKHWFESYEARFLLAGTVSYYVLFGLPRSIWLINNNWKYLYDPISLFVTILALFLLLGLPFFLAWLYGFLFKFIRWVGVNALKEKGGVKDSEAKQE